MVAAPFMPPQLSFASGSAGVKLCKLFAQRFIFLLQRFHTPLDGLHSFADLFRGVARRNVLRAVPVVRFDVDYENSLDDCLLPWDDCLLPWHANPFQPILCRVALQDLHPSEDLEAGLPRIVDHDDRDPVVRKQIPSADVLLVSAKISKRQGVIVDHLEETLRTTAMLDVGPS